MKYITIIIICIFIVYYVFIYLKKRFQKRLARKAVSGVDVVKVGLYKEFSERFTMKYRGKGKKYCNKLAAAAVNEIFGDYNEESHKIFDENREKIINEIKNLGATKPELKRIITDTIRIYIIIKSMLNGKPPENTEEIFNNAIERGIFIEGGQAPDIVSFLKTTEEL